MPCQGQIAKKMTNFQKCATQNRKSQNGEQEKSQTSTVTEVQSTKFKRIIGCQPITKDSDK